MPNDTDGHVAPKKDAKSPWTVMIFMMAERLPEWADLSKLASQTINDIKRIKGLYGSSQLRIRIQLHTSESVERWTSSARVQTASTSRPEEGAGRHPEEGLRPLAEDELLEEERDDDLTEGRALGAFLSWGLRTARHVTTDNSMLVMWGHAYPFGIGFRDTGTGVDALDFGELSKVLNRIQVEVKNKFKYMDTTLDILGFDACDLATVELAQHFSPYAKHLVASQVPIPLPGWPYQKILEHLMASHGPGRVPMEWEHFGSYIVRTYCGSYLGRDNAVSLSLLSIKQAKTIFDETELLAERLLLVLDGDTDETDLVARLFDLSQTYRDKPFVDAADLCENLVRYSNDSGVRHLAGHLGNLLTVPMHSELKKNSPPFILDCGRNAHDTVKLHGVSLYAPNVAIDSHDWRRGSYWYRKFNGGRTKWRSLVEALSERSS